MQDDPKNKNSSDAIPDKLKKLAAVLSALGMVAGAAEVAFGSVSKACTTVGLCAGQKPPPPNPDRIEGFAYYEQGFDSKVTKDGRLYPTTTSPSNLPAFNQLYSGQKLRAHDNVRLRDGPAVTYGSKGLIELGQCVSIVAKELEKTDLKSAKTGGWLRVSKTTC